MRIIIKYIALILLFNHTDLSANTISVSNCRYAENKFENAQLGISDAVELDVMYYCPLDDAKPSTPEEVQLVFSKPVLTNHKVCLTKKYKVNARGKSNNAMPDSLWTTSSGLACSDISRNDYISLEYLPSGYSPEVVMIGISDLLKRIGSPLGADKPIFDMPFYRRWFCSDCDEFVNSTKGVALSVKSVSSSNEDKQLNIVLTSKSTPNTRWQVSLIQKESTLYIENITKRIR